MLLEIDGLDSRWQNGVKGYYDSKGGWHDYFDVQSNLAPDIFSRIVNSGKDPRSYDSSSIVENSVPISRPISTVIGPQSIRKLTREEFRQRLVTHFDYRFNVLKDIVWPSRNGVMQPIER